MVVKKGIRKLYKGKAIVQVKELTYMTLPSVIFHLSSKDQKQVFLVRKICPGSFEIQSNKPHSKAHVNWVVYMEERHAKI